MTGPLHDTPETVIAPELWICAPSRALVTEPGKPEINHARLEAAVSHLTALGWRVKEAANVRCLDRSFAGTDIERARGFEEAMCARTADLVMALRGGSGAARTLDLIDWERVGDSHAVFMGLSDLTAINLALLARCGKKSWQGPVAAAFARENEACTSYFTRAMACVRFEETLPVAGPSMRVEGVLWGGNLSVLTSLIGTPYFPKIEGGILYLEDINEPAWRLSRMISQLKLSGILDRQRLVLAGDFTGADKNAGEGAARYTLSDALSECGVPVVSGLPFGHIAGTMCLPFGVEARADVREGMLTLSAFECPSPTEHPGAEQANAPLWWV